MPDDYNQFFNPNICHVCKSANNGNLIICDECYMISYCSKDHRTEHHSSHTDICEVIHKLTTKDPQWNTRYPNMQEWIQSRKEFLHLVKLQLSRDLKPYEVQMIMFVKSCLICHQQTNLYSCTMCHSANYCMDHTQAFENLHNFRCKELLLCLSLDIEFVRGNNKCKVKFNRFPDERPCVDTDTFIKHYVQRQSMRNVEDWNCPEYFYSDYASGPLTAYYGLMDANLLDEIDMPELESFSDSADPFVIHIINATHLEKDYVASWELILHIFRNRMKILQVVVVGHELQDESNVEVDCCSKCKHYGQTFVFESHRMWYHNYVDSELFKRPNMIVALQADFTEGEEWLKTISKLQFQDCPLVITAKSKLRAEQNIGAIQKVLNNISISPAYHDRNKFCSRRPCRDIDTDYMFFRNDFLTIYRRLNNLKTEEEIVKIEEQIVKIEEEMVKAEEEIVKTEEVTL